MTLSRASACAWAAALSAASIQNAMPDSPARASSALGGNCAGSDLGEFAQDGGADFAPGRFACRIADVELDHADGIAAVGRLAAQPVAADGAEEALAVGESGGGVVRGLPQQIALHFLDHRAVGAVHQRQFQVFGPLRLAVFQRLQQILALEVELLDAAIVGEHVHRRLVADPDQVERGVQRLELQPVADAQAFGQIVLRFAQRFAGGIVEAGGDRGVRVLRFVCRRTVRWRAGRRCGPGQTCRRTPG